MWTAVETSTSREKSTSRETSTLLLLRVGLLDKRHHFGLTKRRGRTSEGGIVRQDLGLIQRISRGSTGDRTGPTDIHGRFRPFYDVRDRGRTFAF